VTLKLGNERSCLKNKNNLFQFLAIREQMTMKLTVPGSIYLESLNACGKLVWEVRVYKDASKDATLQCIFISEHNESV
jgi:hypothetical protein